MNGITRLYAENNVLANSNVDFEVLENEIHAVVGENGAGKTTLMKILYGLERPDAGEIVFKGKEVSIHSPLDAGPWESAWCTSTFASFRSLLLQKMLY